VTDQDDGPSSADGVLSCPDSVSHDPPSGHYLDAIFEAIRAFAQELEASRRWLLRAEQTDNQAWRLSFLRAARAAYERTEGRLEAVVARLAALGSADSLPAPLDRIHENLATMRADLDTHAERLRRHEAREAEARPVGRA
jgi:hypothetical protein